jgi:hypothetical protein
MQRQKSLRPARSFALKRKDYLPIFHRKLRYRLAVAEEHSLEGFLVRKFGLGFDHCRHALKAVRDLRVHRVLDPRACRRDRTWRYVPLVARSPVNLPS